MSDCSYIIIHTDATKSNIIVAMNKNGILLATIKHPTLPIWFQDEIFLLHKDFDSISYKTLNIINNVKKIFDGSKVVEFNPAKQEMF